MDELYSKILHDTLHFGGCDADSHCSALLEYLQKVFELDGITHSRLLEAVKVRKAPKILLNVEVIEAKILKPARANGLSDPFCTMYLAGSTDLSHTTSIKPETLNPIWKEEYQLPVENAATDALCIELWNFSPDKTVQEKMKKIKMVKGIKGLKIFLKDVASSASTSKHENKLIGSVFIPLKDIPATGQELSYSVNKKTKTKKRGDVKLHLTFHFENNTKTAFQEHMHLMKNVLLHEIKTSQVESQSWNGSFSTLAENILIQHRVQSRLSPMSVALAQWIEFCNFHILHPLNFTIFLSLLQKLIKPIQEDLMTEEEKILFWTAAVTLLPSCLSGIRHIQVLVSNKKTINEPSIIFSILTLLQELQPPKDFVLFPAQMYDWLPSKKIASHCDIEIAVVEAATQGAAEWFSKVIEKHDLNDLHDDEEKIKGFLLVVDMVTMCLKKTIECHDTIFQEHFHFPYADTLYTLFDNKFSDIIKPTVESIWKCMRPLKFKDNTENGVCDNDPLTIGSALFKLYISLQNFSRLSHTGYQEGLDLILPNKFHQWFQPGVLHWLCISQYKALHWIQKAVQLEMFIPVHTYTSHSSSAWDILHIFDQIKIFWKQLAWPNSEASKEFAEKIICDICECLIFYSTEMCKKAQELCIGEIVSNKEIEVWCLAVRNMDHVQQSIQSIVSEFGVDEILTPQKKTESRASSENCRETVKVVIDNTIEDARNKICEAAVQKMMPSTRKFLVEAFECLDSEERIDKFMSHLDYNIYTLHLHLNSSNFKYVLNIIWKNLYSKLIEVLEINLKLQREQSFFKHFHKILQNLAEFFKHLNESIDFSNLADIEQLLQVNGMETWELVHQYRLDQLSQQKAMQTASHGLLTVKMLFLGDILKIEILNARNLQPISSKGCCYPYVKIYLLPESKFLGVVQPKSKTAKNTVVPLFEENFVIQLNSTQMKVKNAMVMFMVKEKIFPRRNRYLGETLVSFDDISRYDGTTKFEQLKQMHLKLNPPTKLDSGAFVILEHYHEKLAREFIKSRRLRKCKSKVTQNIHAISGDVWVSVINVLSYMSKGPIHINFLPFLPLRGEISNSGT